MALTFEDGTGDVRWNLRYLDLLRYHRKHGHCMVMTREVPLGKWVAWQRESYRKNYYSLTLRRRELLDQLGFVWEAKHANRKPFVDTGDPRLNKAIATRIVFGSHFTDRQVFQLAGYTKDEMLEVRNPAHQWRNGLVVLRKRLDARMKSFLARSKKEDDGVSNLPRRKTHAAVQDIITILQDKDNANRYIQVYGQENARLLQSFLSSTITPDQAFVAWHANKKSTDPVGTSAAGLNGTTAETDVLLETRPPGTHSDENNNNNNMNDTIARDMDDTTGAVPASVIAAAVGMAGIAPAVWDTPPTTTTLPASTEPTLKDAIEKPGQETYEHHDEDGDDEGTKEAEDDDDEEGDNQYAEDPATGSPWRRGYILPTSAYGD